jgi:hypothetical protein
MRDRPGRKVLVALTDGLDTDFTTPSGPITAGMYPILRNVAAAASRAGVTVIVILPGPTGRGYLAVQDLALQTGGWYAYPGEDFPGTVRRLGERLLAGYVIEYDVEGPGAPDRKRSIEISFAGERPRGWEVRSSMGAYGRLGLFEALAADLEGGTAAQRARAAREIGYLAGEEAAGLLRDALGDRDAAVRAAAASALAERRDPGAMGSILDLLAEGDPAVRSAAYEGSVRYGRAAIHDLAARGRDRGPARPLALRALGAIGGDEAAAVLVERLADDRCDVRAEAAAAAGILLAGESGGVEGWRRASEILDDLERALRTLRKDPCAAAADAARGAMGPSQD